MLLSWLIGWPCLIAGAMMLVVLAKKVVIPHEKYKFDNTNEFGAVALESWDEVVKYKKREAKREAVEAAVGLPAVILFMLGLGLVLFPLLNSLFL